MEHQIFCDGIGRISVIGGVVRLDLFTYSPTETDANGQPRPVLSHRIVMGMEGFMRSSEKVVEAVQQINRAAARPEAPPRAPQPAPQPPPQRLQPVQAPTPPPPQPQAAQPAPSEVPSPVKPPFP
jgi:hypothetical protein